MAKQSAIRADVLFVALRQSSDFPPVASVSLGDAFGNADQLEPDESALVGVYRLEKKIRVTLRPEMKPA